MRTLHVVLVAIALGCAGPAFADKGGKGKDKGHAAEHSGHRDGRPEHGAKTFSAHERSELERWSRSNLPPGLAKKGKVPPGWEKKLQRGQRVPDDLWRIRVPLPQDILVKLPPPPPGVAIVRVHDRVLKVVEKTHELLDEIGLPHPPTPGSRRP